jgi:hypothetical protein
LPAARQYHDWFGASRHPTAPELLEEVVAFNDAVSDAIALPILRRTVYEQGYSIRGSPEAIAHQCRQDAANTIRARVVDLFFRRIHSGNADSIEQFFALGLVALNTYTWLDETPVMAAAESGSVPVMRVLLNAGANFDELVWTHMAPLQPGAQSKVRGRVQRTPL